MSDDLAERLRAEAARLRLKADGYEAAAKLIEEEHPKARKPKAAKKAGKQRLDPTNAKGGQKGETTRRVAEYLKTHPKAGVTEITRSLGFKSVGQASYHLAKLRRSA